MVSNVEVSHLAKKGVESLGSRTYLWLTRFCIFSDFLFIMPWRRKRVLWFVIETEKTPGNPFLCLFIYLSISLFICLLFIYLFIYLIACGSERTAIMPITLYEKNDFSLPRFHTVHYDKQILRLLGPYIWSELTIQLATISDISRWNTLPSYLYSMLHSAVFKAFLQYCLVGQGGRHNGTNGVPTKWQ